MFHIIDQNAENESRQLTLETEKPGCVALGLSRRVPLLNISLGAHIQGVKRLHKQCSFPGETMNSAPLPVLEVKPSEVKSDCTWLLLREEDAFF